MHSLTNVVLYLFATVIAVAGCRLLKLPAMLGYVVIGILSGPNALALFDDPATLGHLGEFGVVFLMFVIGLEFSLGALKAMRRHVLGLGGLQVVVTMLVTIGGIGLIEYCIPDFFGVNWMGALAIGAAMAMSSTAIVMKLLAERGELESEHGRRIVGILLFQDLAVVPLMVIVPALSGSGAAMFANLGMALLKAIVMIAVLFLIGRPLIRWWLNLVARRKSDELFMLNVLFMALGLAWVTEMAGLSLALGAFIAGMLISETKFKHTVEADIKPFHDILLGVFFISVGMMLDWHVVLEYWRLVLLLLFIPILIKLIIMVVLARILGATVGNATRVGLYLAQAGEFGFVLLSLTHQNHLIPATLLDPILVSMVLSMMVTPFIIMHSEKIVSHFARSEWFSRSLQITQVAQQAMGVANHVIIVGFGRCGQNLARMLEAQGIAYVALDLDSDRVQQAAKSGQPATYGDATRENVLLAAGLLQAKCVAITYDDERSSEKVLQNIRKHANHMSVVVRTQDDRHLEELRAMGATEVVPEIVEGSLMLSSHVLALMGVPTQRVVRLVQKQRAERYELLRSYFHGEDDEETLEEQDQERLICITIPDHAVLLGSLYRTLSFPGITVVSVRREDGINALLNDGAGVEAGDTVVLSGTLADLEKAKSELQN